MRHIIFVIDDQVEKASGNEMQAIDAFNDMLIEKGYWITAAGINHGPAATLIDNRAGAGEVAKGSLYDDPEHYSGFWLIDVPDSETALQLALEGSKACNRKVELRPYLG
ncbi:MAG: YciI family protein [Rhodoluna sp.]|nr:YciI family protein [Rhodoluna sp.]